MKAFLFLGLLALTLISAEEIYFLSDDYDENDVDGLSSNKLDFGNVTSRIGTIVDLAGKIINTFKTSKSSVIKERILGQGFRYFKGGCTVESLAGLFPFRFENFAKKLMGRVGIPEAKKKTVYGQLEDLLDTDKGIAFKTYDILFNSQSTSNDKVHSLTFVGSYNDRGTIDIFTSDMHADFKLAPDILIISDSASYVGGIFSSTKDKVVERPKDISYEDLKAAIAFFEYIGLEQFAEFLGIKIPKLNG